VHTAASHIPLVASGSIVPPGPRGEGEVADLADQLVQPRGRIQDGRPDRVRRQICGDRQHEPDMERSADGGAGEPEGRLLALRARAW
jgi:hypothetical protein